MLNKKYSNTHVMNKIASMRIFFVEKKILVLIFIRAAWYNVLIDYLISPRNI
jgi:hypothetical protein